MIEDFDKYLANNKTYISDFDITKHIVLDNESNYWYSAEYVDKMLKKQDKEIERLNNIINRTTKYVESLSSKGRGCDIYEDIKQEILQELKGSNKE